jgi:hypothetical protein
MFSNQFARMSVDSLSPLSPSTTRSEFPFHQRQGSVTSYPATRRSSNASIHSIGGHLDTTSNWNQQVHEFGQNGMRPLSSDSPVRLAAYMPPQSHLYPSPAPDCSDGTAAAHRCSRLERSQASDLQGHSSRHPDQYHARRCRRVQALPIPGRRPV